MQPEIPQIKVTENVSEPKMDMKKIDLVDEAPSRDLAGQENPPAASRKIKKIAIGIVAAILIFIVTVAFPLWNVYRGAKTLADSAKSLQTSFQSKDLGKIKSATVEFKNEINHFDSKYNGIRWMRFVPFVGGYVSDGDAAIKAAKYGMETVDIVIPTIEPYADIIGLKGGDKAKNGEESANDRIQFIIQTIGGVLPKIDEISQKASFAKTEIDKINPNRYPEKFKGKEIRSKVKQIVELADKGTVLITQSKPLLQSARYLLGIDGERTYLLLFQNDKELRPTGGFLTAYSIMKVKNGKLLPVISSDMYSLDAAYTAVIPADDAFVKYIKGPYTVSTNFRLRDMNWSPDFKVSMDAFSKEAQKVGVKNIDGIIAVDTQPLVDILAVLGQIGVPGFGNFSSNNDPRCDCPNVVFELEDFADVEGPVVWSENEPGKIVFAPKNYGKNRKAIVGPLMNSVLSNALGQPKDKLPGLFEAGWNAVLGKHVLFYMFDQKVQASLEEFGIAGRIREYNGDFLHINDANLGGRKSNLYVTQEVQEDYSITNGGTIEKTITITYKNSKGSDGWLNSVLPNWTRVYVPKGSQLISEEGFEDKGKTYEDLGHTVFSGGFKLRPQGVSKITLKYKLPFKAKDTLNLLIEKQPGTQKPTYSINVGRQKEDFFLDTDREFHFKL